jgi:hypothetical protein
MVTWTKKEIGGRHADVVMSGCRIFHERLEFRGKPIERKHLFYKELHNSRQGGSRGVMDFSVAEPFSFLGRRKSRKIAGGRSAC